MRDVSELTPENLIHDVLAHNVTVSVRRVWYQLNDAKKVEQLRWINDLMHRVVLKSAALRSNRNEVSELDHVKVALASR